MERIYINKKSKAEIRYYSYFGNYIIKTKEGIIVLNEEILKNIKKDRGLVKAIKKILF